MKFDENLKEKSETKIDLKVNEEQQRDEARRRTSRDFSRVHFYLIGALVLLIKANSLTADGTISYLPSRFLSFFPTTIIIIIYLLHVTIIYF